MFPAVSFLIWLIKSYNSPKSYQQQHCNTQNFKKKKLKKIKGRQGCYGGGQGSEKIMDPKTEKDSTFIVLVFVQEKKWKTVFIKTHYSRNYPSQNMFCPKNGRRDQIKDLKPRSLFLKMPN